MKRISKFQARYNFNMIKTNLYSTWSKRNSYEVKTGSGWYAEANLYLSEIANHFNLNRDIVIGIAAALSPANAWNSNVKDTYNLIRFKGKLDNSTTYGENIRKAKKILKNGKPLRYLSGRKVTAFYDNILNPDSSKQVTIDTHIIRCAVNDSNCNVHYIPPKYFTEIERVITELASENHLRPLQVQAILWVSWKRLTFSRDTNFNQGFFKF